MFRTADIIIALVLLSVTAYSQNTITGTFPHLANQQIIMKGFNGFETYSIDSTQISEAGEFVLDYSADDYGMGYMVSQDNRPFIVVLSGEDIGLKGETFSYPETIQILNGKENKLFGQYASEHPRREQALSAWVYLEKIYNLDKFLAVQEVPKQAITSEKQRLKAEDSLFLARLNHDSYVSYYLPLRKLVSSVSTIAQYRTEEIPASITSFREMDYTDPRLYKSGMLGDVIDSHFWLIENSGRSLDSVYIEMNVSIDYMIDNLLTDEQKLNEITEYLFKLLENRSLFKASEYLALRLLNEQSCTMNNDFKAQLESYRAMKKGNVAPDFALGEDCLAPGYASAEVPTKLSDIKSNYKVVVFAASWCPQCPAELSQIARLYEKWKKYGLEVVFVSLDEEKEIFKSFANVFSFISVCDYQKWESPVVKSYHVFATPTIYLLDDKRTIMLRPNSVNQLDSWVELNLIPFPSP
ncbi:MAG: TlpA family protein disulfide reductase [Bacteroidales bacterium]|nr:TlpA family protein disulfide reductase [Bacteroidales bacterium]